MSAIVDKEGFQELCQTMRHRLGVGGVSSALGDGAKWIWNVRRPVFGTGTECLDIYHAAEHTSDCGKVLFGETQAKTDWFERMHMVLLSEGLGGMERELTLLLGLSAKRQSAVDSLLKYFCNNSERLHYCERLASGRVIGSALIEGAGGQADKTDGSVLAATQSEQNRPHLGGAPEERSSGHPVNRLKNFGLVLTRC